MVELCKRRYGERYDLLTTEAWVRNHVLQNPLIYLSIRNDAAFLIAYLHNLPWTAQEYEAEVALICAEEGRAWKAIELLRASIEWGRWRQAKRWIFSSGTSFDFAPIAKRLHAYTLPPRYQIDLGG